MQPTFQVGDLEVQGFIDGMLKTSIDLVIGMDRAQAETLVGGTEGGAFFIPVNNFLFRREGKTILIDAGAGNTMQPTLGKLPANLRALLDLVVQLLMALIAAFMVVWGARLVNVTWHNTIADFPFLSVGVTYLPIPVGGVFLLLFIIERIFLGAPPDPIAQHLEAVPFD